MRLSFVVVVVFRRRERPRVPSSHEYEVYMCVCACVGAVDPPRHGATVLRLPSAPFCTPWNDVVRPPKDTPKDSILHRPRR